MSILSTRFHPGDDTPPPMPPRVTEPPPPESRPPDFWRGWLRPAALERFTVAADILLIMICGFVSAVGYHWYAAQGALRSGPYAAAGVLVAINFALLFAVQHGYQLRAIANLWRQVRITATTWTAVFAFLLALAFGMKISEGFSRGATILFFLSGLTVLSLWKIAVSRFTAHALRTGAFTNSRIVVIAEQGLAASSTPLLELRQNGYRPARILEISAKELSSPLLMSAVRSRLGELVDYARDNRIEQVFLLIKWDRQHAIDSILDALKVLPIPVHLIPDHNVARFLKYPVMTASTTWTIELRRAPLTKGERSLKRLMDVAGAALALLVFAPIMLAAAALIKLESKGPVFFRQTRNGFNGQAFRIFKFRSMCVTEDGPQIVQATRHDPRVTRIGRWLRKTSIDELPQLLNVLSGEMSLVGPRPHAAAHNSKYEQLIGNYAFRHHVKPGITGWAQVNGYRGETKAIGLMEKRVDADLFYINNWSIWLDLSIILQTLVAVLRQPSAY